MNTEIAIEGADFLINGERTYPGRSHEGRRIEGLLLNSRMIQAVFDDECADTRDCWAYPDTGLWDADRNTNEFCAMLPSYHAHGLRAVTVGLQGGGSIYRDDVYNAYINSAFHTDGSLKEAYFERLDRILEAADRCGMVVIVNYFYWRQERFDNDAAVERATEEATARLLATGYRNILTDIKNEIRERDGILASRGIHRLLEIARETSLNGRRLPIGVSTHPFKHLPEGQWPDLCDYFMPHGNDSDAGEWGRELRQLKQDLRAMKRTVPICCNEDSIDMPSFEAALDAGISWGYFDQGYGCGQRQHKHDWLQREREPRFENLSGFQTLPVNWSINTEHKRAFFNRLAEVTGSS